MLTVQLYHFSLIIGAVCVVQVGVLGGTEANWPHFLEPLSEETRFSLLFDGAAGERTLVTMEAASAKERMAVVRDRFSFRAQLLPVSTLLLYIFCTHAKTRNLRACCHP